MDVLELDIDLTESPRPRFFYGVQGTKFADAAEAWFWTLDCLEARADGSKACASLKLGRPCDPDDVVNAMRRLDLPKVHARTVMAWGKKRTAPPAGSDALRLWNEVMERLTITLQAKGIVRTPASSDLELVDALLTGIDLAPVLEPGLIVGTGGFRHRVTATVRLPVSKISADRSSAERAQG